MTTESNMSQTGNRCKDAELGQLLPDYILEMLDDANSLKVELHLIDCQRCKDHYLTVLQAASQARSQRAGKSAPGVFQTARKATTNGVSGANLAARRKAKVAGRA